MNNRPRVAFFPCVYHEVDGVQAPRRMVINQDGKRYISLEITSTRYVERHDESLFAKP